MKKLKSIKQLKKIARWLMGFLVGIQLVIIVLLQIPAVQRGISSIAETQLEQLLHTRVKIGKINAGLLNRFIIDDVFIWDQQQQEMIKITRLSAKFEILPLFQGKISITNAQLFGFKIALYQEKEDKKPNYQFLLDALASQDSVSSSINLRINSLLIRRGNISYDKFHQPQTPGKFNINHINISKLSCNISLKALTADSINLNLKKISFEEQCGLKLKKLNFKFAANSQKAVLSQFEIQLPHTSIHLNSFQAKYHWNVDSAFSEKFKQSLTYRGKIKPSKITLSDISCFVPVLNQFNQELLFSSSLSGNNKAITITNFELYNKEKDISLKTEAEITSLNEHETSPAIHANIRELNIKSTGMALLIQNLTDKEQDLHAILSRIGDLAFQGEVDYSKRILAATGELNTSIGNIKATGSLVDQNYVELCLVSKNFELGKLAGPESKLGNISLDVDLNGYIKKGKYPELYIKGVVDKFEYARYQYHHITLNGCYKSGGFEGSFLLDDPNGKLELNGKMNLVSSLPFFNLTASLNNFSPHLLHLTDNYANTSVGGQLIADFRGKTIDYMDGTIELKNFEMVKNDEVYQVDSILIESYSDKLGRHMSINSDFIDAQIDGKFKFKTLVGKIKSLMGTYLPSLIGPSNEELYADEYITFGANLRSTDALQYMLDIPLKLNQPSTFSGSLNGQTREIKIDGSIPDIEYNSEHLKNIVLQCDNTDGEMACKLNLFRQMGDSEVEITLGAVAGNDFLRTSLTWNNHQEQVYSGRIATLASFRKNPGKDTEIKIEFVPTRIIINDSLWNVHPATVELYDKKIAINKFRIEQSGRHLEIDGIISKNTTDSIVVDLKDINLQYVFNIINFHAVEFGGQATGRVYASHIFDSPQADTHLHVKNFTFNNGYMGDMNIYGKWDTDNKSVYLNAHMNDPKARSITQVEGTITPGHGPGTGLNLNVKTDRINLYFLNEYTQGIFTNFQGRASGWARIFGPFKNINLEGDMLVNEAQMKVDALNVQYHIINDSVIMRPDNIFLRNIYVYDNQGGPAKDAHYAIVNGVLQHSSFSNMLYNFDIEAHNVLGFDQKHFGNEVFCGTVYGSGNVKINGGPGEINIDINATPQEQTSFIYNSSSPETLTNNQFITYVGRKDSNRTPLSPLEAERKFKKEQREAEEAVSSDMRLNFQLNVTPQATMKIIMDAKSGDYISLNGNGNLRASYYNKGRFQLYGTYRVDHGMYKLSLQDVIRKDFQFNPGGTIIFGGEPYQADLNLQAVYTVPSVSLNDLSARATFSQSNVRVNCIMNLGGKAKSPQVSFDFDLPNVNEDEKQMVRSLISTEEEKNMQIIYLLGIGRFYTYDYTNTDQSQSSVAMKSLLSSTLSGQLNQMLSTIVGNSNWNIGTNLSTGDQGWSDMDIEGLLSGKLLNNRLLINGNFGYRDNPTSASNFIGDFDLQWLLTKNGNISLKAYSETNDRYFTKSSLTTQGIGIMLKRDFGSWRELFKLNKKSTQGFPLNIPLRKNN